MTYLENNANGCILSHYKNKNPWFFPKVSTPENNAWIASMIESEMYY